MNFMRMGVGTMAVLWALLPGVSRAEEAGSPFRYPDAPRSSTIEDYHGSKVSDLFRPLEDPDSPETRTWV